MGTPTEKPSQPPIQPPTVAPATGGDKLAHAMYGTGSGAVTAVTLSMDGGAMGVNLIGVPVPTAMTSDRVAVSFLADAPPAGAWTATLQRRAVGANGYTAVATFSIDTS